MSFEKINMLLPNKGSPSVRIKTLLNHLIDLQ